MFWKIYKFDLFRSLHGLGRGIRTGEGPHLLLIPVGRTLPIRRLHRPVLALEGPLRALAEVVRVPRELLEAPVQLRRVGAERIGAKLVLATHVPVPLVDLALLQPHFGSQLSDLLLRPGLLLVELLQQQLVLALVLAEPFLIFTLQLACTSRVRRGGVLRIKSLRERALVQRYVEVINRFSRQV